MANHWLREIQLTAAARGGISFYSKMLCWWMYHVLGYTNFAESLGGAGSYDPTDYTGVTYATSVGSINVSGTDGYFRDDTNSPFTAGDVGKWILLVDPTNGENSGWYEVDGYVDADRVSIDYKSAPGEYPIQNTNDDMSYYMMAVDNNMPDTLNDEWQLRTPHADAWEIKFILQANYYLRCLVALDTFAVGNKILQMSTPAYKHFGQNSQSVSSELYYYAYGTDDGRKLCIHMFTTDSGGNSGLMMAKVLPFETVPAHTDDELWVLFGQETVGDDSHEGFQRWYGASGNSYLNGYVWREADSSVNFCHALEWSHSTYDLGFTWVGGIGEPNARTGKNDLKPGMTFVIDPFNDAHKYEIMGEYAPCEMARRNFNKMTTINDGGTKDKLQIYDGFVIPWPGITPQFSPAP